MRNASQQSLYCIRESIIIILYKRMVTLHCWTVVRITNADDVLPFEEAEVTEVPEVMDECSEVLDCMFLLIGSGFSWALALA